MSSKPGAGLRGVAIGVLIGFLVTDVGHRLSRQSASVDFLRDGIPEGVMCSFSGWGGMSRGEAMLPAEVAMSLCLAFAQGDPAENQPGVVLANANITYSGREQPISISMFTNHSLGIGQTRVSIRDDVWERLVQILNAHR